MIVIWCCLSLFIQMFLTCFLFLLNIFSLNRRDPARTPWSLGSRCAPVREPIVACPPTRHLISYQLHHLAGWWSKVGRGLKCHQNVTKCQWFGEDPATPLRVCLILALRLELTFQETSSTDYPTLKKLKPPCSEWSFPFWENYNTIRGFARTLPWGPSK